MSNHITIELCEADRARIDNFAIKFGELIDRLPPRIAVEVADPIQKQLSAIVANAKEQKTEDPAEKSTEAPQEATEAAPPTEDTPPWEEKPTAAKNEPAPTVTLEQIQQKVVQLCAADAGKKKAQVREIINLYGTKVSDLKERPDKWAEVWGLLTALEKEATA